MWVEIWKSTIRANPRFLGCQTYSYIYDGFIPETLERHYIFQYFFLFLCPKIRMSIKYSQFRRLHLQNRATEDGRRRPRTFSICRRIFSRVAWVVIQDLRRSRRCPAFLRSKARSLLRGWQPTDRPYLAMCNL